MKHSNFAQAQGTIEYLVVMAIIVVLSLVVVSLLSSSIGSSTAGISSNVGAISRSSNMISVSDAAIDVDGNGLVLLQNNSSDNLTITSVVVSGVDKNFAANLAPFEEKGFTLENLSEGCSCVDFVGSKKTCDLEIVTRSVNGLVNSYHYSITIDCVTDARPAEGASIAQNMPPVITLMSPLEGFIVPDQEDANFVFMVSSLNSITSCVLYTRGGIWSMTLEGPVYNPYSANLATFSNPQKDVNIWAAISPFDLFLPNDTYPDDWDVNCTDSSGTVGVSEPGFMPSIWIAQ